MKTLYFECNMGAAGDMLMAALLELTDDSTKFLEKINSLGLSGVRVSAQLENKCGINGTKMTVLINGEEEGHHHHHDHHDHCDDDHHHH
ncbi:MAG: nickel insertion protein, partial [Anaerovoracaceae bacterium]